MVTLYSMFNFDEVYIEILSLPWQLNIMYVHVCTCTIAVCTVCTLYIVCAQHVYFIIYMYMYMYIHVSVHVSCPFGTGVKCPLPV